MREIKYKAFDGKEIWDVYSLDLENGIWKGNKGKLFCEAPIMQGSICSLIQYIGLTDKNGKDIFDGDIVKGDNGGIAEVAYIPCTFSLYPVNDDIDIELINEMDEKFNYEGREGTFIGNLYWLEIIGNKFLNPELYR